MDIGLRVPCYFRIMSLEASVFWVAMTVLFDPGEVPTIEMAASGDGKQRIVRFPRNGHVQERNRV